MGLLKFKPPPSYKLFIDALGFSTEEKDKVLSSTVTEGSSSDSDNQDSMLKMAIKVLKIV